MSDLLSNVTSKEIKAAVENSPIIRAAVLAERNRIGEEAIKSLVFEAGKSYLVFVSADLVSVDSIKELPKSDIYATFIFVNTPFGAPVSDCVMRVELKPGSTIFVDRLAISEPIDGVTLIPVTVPPGRTLSEVIDAEDVIGKERERCAMVADTYSTWSEIGDYIGVSREIAEKIRSGQ